MIKNIYILGFLSILSLIANAQTSQFVELWPDGIPCANDLTEQADTSDIIRISRVHSPTLEVYKAANPNGAGVMICPGGGYTILAYHKEGTKLAKWFNQRGVTAFVLKSRLPHWETNECRSTVALDDALRGMQIIRTNADKYGIDKDMIGVMGFSAGGHLASSLSTHFNEATSRQQSSEYKASARPDFSILVYPVISMDTTFTHMGSRNNLIGKTPKYDATKRFSNELQITEDTPPTILFHSSDDKAVPVENSIKYYQNLVKNNVPASLHVYESGGHGYGMALDKSGAVSKWLEDLENWLVERGIL